MSGGHTSGKPTRRLYGTATLRSEGDMSKENPTLLDIARIERQVEAIHDACERLRTSGMREEALLYLLVGSAPKGPRGGQQLTTEQARLTLEAIRRLPHFMFDQGCSPGDRQEDTE